MLAEFPSGQGQVVIAMACLTLGRRPRSAEYSEHTPYGEMFHPYSLDDLREQMNTLAERIGVREEFLIPGMFSFLIDHFTRTSDSTPDSINFHLDNLRHLQDELRKPVEERKGRMTDAQINRLMESVKSIMNGKPEQRRSAEELIERLKAEWNGRFPDAIGKSGGCRRCAACRAAERSDAMVPNPAN